MESNLPLVTIGIPTYNRASGRLGDAIRFALAQTYSNIEIVISDNCSTDNTSEVVASFNNEKIRYIRQKENIGPFNNFQACLENARGEYFYLFHDDDQVDNDFVESCIDATQERENIGLVRTGIRVIDGEGCIINERPNNADGLSAKDFVSAWFRHKTASYLPCTLFNTERLKEVGGIRSPHNMFCDAFAIIKLVAKYEHADVVDVKASFRRHDDNMGSSSRVLDWINDSVELLELVSELFPNDKNQLRVEGNRFFCMKNYEQTQKMSARLWQKTMMYLKVRKTFDYAVPLWKFYRKNELRPRLAPTKNKLLGRT